MRPTPDTEIRLYKINQAIQQLARGRVNCTGEVTLTASTTTTTVDSQIVSEGDVIALMPKTANAAAEVGAGTVYVSATSRGSFTITHASAASTDRTFGWVAFG